jgi:L-cysteine S-thiosulfotransferase
MRTAVCSAIMLVCVAALPAVRAQSIPPPAIPLPAPPSPGEALAFDRAMGNCLACHTMRGSDVPSNVGPELSDMKARFPNRADLVLILTNEEARNPQTMMPPFGRDMILTADQINRIVDFLYTL